MVKYIFNFCVNFYFRKCFWKRLKIFFSLWSIQNYAKNCMLFLFTSTVKFIYLAMQKTPSEPIDFSSLFHCQTSRRNLHLSPLHPPHSLLSTLQPGVTQHCSETILRVLSVAELNRMIFFFSVCIPYPLSLQCLYYFGAFPRQCLLPQKCCPLS